MCCCRIVIYFVVVVLIGGFFLLNILSGIVWAKFEEEHKLLIEQQRVMNTSLALKRRCALAQELWKTSKVFAFPHCGLASLIMSMSIIVMIPCVQVYHSAPKEFISSTARDHPGLRILSRRVGHVNRPSGHENSPRPSSLPMSGPAHKSEENNERSNREVVSAPRSRGSSKTSSPAVPSAPSSNASKSSAPGTAQHLAHEEGIKSMKESESTRDRINRRTSLKMSAEELGPGADWEAAANDPGLSSHAVPSSSDLSQALSTPIPEKSARHTQHPATLELGPTDDNKTSVSPHHVNPMKDSDDSDTGDQPRTLTSLPMKRPPSLFISKAAGEAGPDAIQSLEPQLSVSAMQPSAKASKTARMSVLQRIDSRAQQEIEDHDKCARCNKCLNAYVAPLHAPMLSTAFEITMCAIIGIDLLFLITDHYPSSDEFDSVRLAVCCDIDNNLHVFNVYDLD